MWIITIYYCLVLITPCLNIPVTTDDQMFPDDMDIFYRDLRDTFDQYLKQIPTQRKDEDPKNENVVETEDNLNLDKEAIKLKRDSNPYENQNDESKHIGLSPMYPCDIYDELTHTCVNVRQMGTTLTLGVKMPKIEKNIQYRVQWYRVFKRRGEMSDLKEELTKDKSPWNLNIGGNNNELRVSPITETDFSYNYFVAMVDNNDRSTREKKTKNKQFIKFSIEPINIDMGALYPGEELVIYARAFMELPVDSMTIEWSLSNSEFQTAFGLPSNMKTNSDGSSVIVKELKTTVDKILICSVYSNKHIFLARRNFLFRKIEQKETYLTSDYTSIGHNNRRKKRSYEDSEGFLEEEHMHKKFKYPSDSVDYEIDNKRKSFYGGNSEQFGDYRNQENDEHLLQYSTALPVNSELFYRNGDETSQFNNQKPARRKKDMHRLGDLQATKSLSQASKEYTNARFPEESQYGLSDDSQYDEEAYDYMDSEPNGFPKKIKHTVELKENNDVNFKPRHKEKHSYSGDEGSNSKLQKINALIQKANSLNREPKTIDDFTDLYFERTDKERLSFDDMESMLIADCKENTNCSVHATCHRNENGKNFCRCLHQYRGNGLFCWMI